MSRFKKGVWSGALSLSVVAAMLAGCAGNGNEGAASSSPGGSKEASGSKGATVTLKVMANYDSPDLSESDQRFVKQVEEYNNVKLDLIIPPITGYAEKLQIMLASGDYPDIVFFPDTNDTSFRNALKDGILIPVNDYIANEPELQKYTYPSAWDSLKVNQDDNIYGIPRTSILRNDGYWVRKDWLDKVGIAVPSDGLVTPEEFENILKKFTFDDPDGNGKPDTYGYAGAVNANKVLQPILAGAFGERGWQETTGGDYKYMDAMYDPASTVYKDALAYTAKLYQEGVYDPDSATNDATKQRERFWRGLTGVFPGFAAHYSWHLPELQKATPSAELTYIWVKDKDGKPSFNNGSTSATGTWGFWAITKSAKDPQKAADLLNSWLTDDLWPTVKDGYEGSEYTLQNGQKVAVELQPTNYVRKNTMRRANDQSFFISVGTPQEVVDKITPWLKTSVESVVTSKDLGFMPDAAKQPKYQDYQKEWDQTIMKIIMGKAPVEAFDKLLSGWYASGGTDYVKQMNDYIAKLNG